MQYRVMFRRRRYVLIMRMSNSYKSRLFVRGFKERGGNLGLRSSACSKLLEQSHLHFGTGLVLEQGV